MIGLQGKDRIGKACRGGLNVIKAIAHGDCKRQAARPKHSCRLSAATMTGP
jgi:hypothetical protein